MFYFFLFRLFDLGNTVSLQKLLIKAEKIEVDNHVGKSLRARSIRVLNAFISRGTRS
jgi:hypothetical protein